MCLACTVQPLSASSKASYEGLKETGARLSDLFQIYNPAAVSDMVEQVFSSFYVPAAHPGTLLKRSYDWVDLSWGLGFCVQNKPPRDADTGHRQDCKARLLGQSVDPPWSRLVTPIPGSTWGAFKKYLCQVSSQPFCFIWCEVLKSIQRWKYLYHS